MKMLRYYAINNVLMLRLLALRHYHEVFYHNRAKIAINFEFSEARRHSCVIVDRTIPSPDRDAGSRHVLSLVNFLIEDGFQVTFISTDLACKEPYETRLQEIGAKILAFPEILSVRQFLKRCGSSLDVIIPSRYPIARKYFLVARLLHDSGTRIIFNVEDRYHLQIRHALIRLIDTTIVISPMEQRIFHQTIPDSRIDIVSFIGKVAHIVSPRNT